MSEDKKASDMYMDIITQMLKKKKVLSSPEDLSVSKLYETMNMVVSDLDTSIKECKRYNEAKIHRKYEIIINDLQKRIRFLEQKIMEEHRARSPSKKYVEDLLDKLIKFKFENQTLTSRINVLTTQNEEIKAKIKIYEEGTQDNDKNKETIHQKQQDQARIEISGAILKQEITTFMKLKQNLRRHEKQEKTSFERFLKKSQDKFQNWSLRQFLTAIEKWTVDFYQNGAPRVNSNPKRTKQQMRLRDGKPSANSFRLRSKKAVSIEYGSNNRTLYENVLR